MLNTLPSISLYIIHSPSNEICVLPSSYTPGRIGLVGNVSVSYSSFAFIRSKILANSSTSSKLKSNLVNTRSSSSSSFLSSRLMSSSLKSSMLFSVCFDPSSSFSLGFCTINRLLISFAVRSSITGGVGGFSRVPTIVA